MEAYAAARRLAGRPDQLLYCELGAFPVAHGWHVNCHSKMLSASWEAVMSRAGEIDRFHEDDFPDLLSLPPLRGSPAVLAWRRRRREGGDPNKVPCTTRCATAMANAVAFFAMMDA